MRWSCMTNLSFSFSFSFCCIVTFAFFFLSNFLFDFIHFFIILIFSQLHFSKHAIISLIFTWCTHYNLHYSQTIAIRTYNAFYNFNPSLGRILYSVKIHQNPESFDTHSFIPTTNSQHLMIQTLQPLIMINFSSSICAYIPSILCPLQKPTFNSGLRRKKWI